MFRAFLSALRGLIARPAQAAKIATATAVLIAAPFVAQWEGVKTVPYADQLAGGLMTVCAGETRVEMRVYTEAECMQMLQSALEENLAIVRANVKVPTTPEMDAALISFIHNVGPNAFKKSTLLRKLNAGDYQGACDELLRWNKAGGKYVQGLANRRQAERLLCLKGV